MRLVQSDSFTANSDVRVILNSMSYAASKLWNVANYEKHNYKALGMEKFPNWYDQKKRLKDSYWFKALPSHTAQQVLALLQNAWVSFYELQRTGGVENPRPPRFKEQGIMIPFDFTTAVRHMGDGLFRFTISKQEREYLKGIGVAAEFLYLHMPRFQGLERIKMINLYPEKGDRWTARAIYEVDEPELKPDNGNYLSIDLGVRNFITCYSSPTVETFILGRRFIEVNHFFNKEVARLNSIFAKQQVASGWTKKPKESKRVKTLRKQYRDSVKDILHKTSAYIRDYCLANDINTVVIGDITGIRDGKDYGKVVNQPFHALPYLQFRQKLEYKLRLNGIRLVQQKEFYSSQCSPFAPSVDKEHATPKKRVNRGLYVDNGVLFNADAVGAYNILRLKLQGDGGTKAPPVPRSATYKVSA